MTKWGHSHEVTSAQWVCPSQRGSLEERIHCHFKYSCVVFNHAILIGSINISMDATTHIYTSCKRAHKYISIFCLAVSEIKIPRKRLNTPGFVVDAGFVQCDVYPVTKVIAEGWHVEYSPAPIICDVYTVVLVMLQVTSIHMDIT